jgi:2,4-dienoyl-CoA reductase-like NADH-dependent reductase (Old Yellow Enzyme family)/thioredoxin reductase
MAQQFKILFSPIKVGSMTVPNRIVVPSHWDGYRSAADGYFPNDQVIGYWELKAKGGAGLICLGVWGVHRTAGWYPDHKDPQYVEKLKRLADAIKRHGSCFVAQVWHPGSQASGYSVRKPDSPTWAPSNIATSMLSGNSPHAMTKDEIKEVIQGYADTAVLCKKAGCDGVEIHGAHQYLPGQFMAPRLNDRTDEYGGDIEGRMRFTLEVIDAVRAAVGRDFTVGIRVDGDQFQPGGVTLDDMKIMAPMMTRTGNLDFINVSLSGFGVIAPMYFPLGFAVYLASGIKQVVDVPVMAVGRIIDPVQAETILAEGHADLVCMNRALICDPELPKKVREGRLDEIRKCMGDSEGCWERVLIGVRCSYNPVIGKETIPGWAELIPAKTKKKVMVIGGGPAGLETARVAAARGHKVSLWEKGDDLGGMVLVAAKAPGRDGFEELPRYYRYQMKLLGVDVHLNTEVTVDTVIKESPDAVVIATGSYPRIPAAIPGINQDNVVTVRDVLTGKAKVGQNVLVSDVHPQLQGLTSADFLAQQGKTVTVIYTGRDGQPTQIEGLTLSSLRQRLYTAGVKLIADEAVVMISGNTVTVANVYSMAMRVIEGVDTVVISYGDIGNDELYYALKDKVKEIYSVGDCKAPRKIMWAVDDGATVGRMI